MSENEGVFRTEEVKEVTIEHKGKTYVLKIKELGWSEMNKVLSKCTAYTQDKKGIFDLDMYYREALIAMVVESPWGPFNHRLLTTISAEFGSKLEALIPALGGGGEAEIPFVPEQS